MCWISRFVRNCFWCINICSYCVCLRCNTVTQFWSCLLRFDCVEVKVTHTVWHVEITLNDCCITVYRISKCVKRSTISIMINYQQKSHTIIMHVKICNILMWILPLNNNKLSWCALCYDQPLYHTDWQARQLWATVTIEINISSNKLQSDM